MLRLTKIAPDAESHEEVFLGRYARLRAWAIQLTQSDREQAEDLLHDAYIQFNLSRPDLNSISNVDGYLYRLLRNLHLSQVRRSLRVQRKTLSIVDYDSAEIGLRSGDPRQQICLQDELRQVCQYACDRKETSRAGSVLILRFLHGYYPREIAQVMRTTRKAVEERLRVARSEAHQYLLNPGKLHFMHQTPGGKTHVPTGFARSADRLLGELRQAVFDSRQGACLERADLTSLYSGKNEAGIDQPTLGHLTSCPECLDEVNRLLNLPLLIERFPTDTIGTDKSSKGDGSGNTGSGSGGGASESERRQSSRRARDVFEHRPAELCVSVNGYLIAAQNVGAEISEQTLSINVAEKIDFIEVFGEQDIRLLFLNVEELPPDGAYQRSTLVELSDDRTLEATLSFSNPWPAVQVLYRDPLASAELAMQADGVLEVDGKAKGNSAERAKTLHENLILRAWRAFSTSGFRLQPGTVTAIISLVLIAALLVVRFHVPAVSAAELLQRSTFAEETIASNPEVVVHRTINLEERAANSAQVLSRRRIEVWQSAAQGIKLRRMYDEQNNLIAGEWSKADGASTVYQRGTKPQARMSPDESAKAVLQTGEFWRLDASARSFDSLVGSAEAITVEEKSDAYLLSYQGRAAGNGDRLLRASLTLNRSNLHAVQQTLTIERNGAVRELKFIETGFVQTSTGSIAPDLFQPEPELLGATSNGLNRTPATSDLLHDSGGPDRSEALASPELEIEVTDLLNRIKANLGEQVSMSRTVRGALRVEALVETEDRKAEMLRALGPIIGNPAVQVDVRTVAEAAQRQQQESRSRDATSQEVEVANSRIPADSELRAYFSARVVGSDAVEQEIDRYAGRVMNHSRQALLQASALKDLVERFSPAEVQALSPEARDKWLGMIREHAEAYRREVAALRQELTSVFGSRPGEGAGEANPARAAGRLLQMSYANDDAVRSAFTVSQDGRTTAGIKSEQFWRSLSAAEKLAAEIQNAYQK